VSVSSKHDWGKRMFFYKTVITGRLFMGIKQISRGRRKYSCVFKGQMAVALHSVM
jgi:hypothetical protein